MQTSEVVDRLRTIWAVTKNQAILFNGDYRKELQAITEAIRAVELQTPKEPIRKVFEESECEEFEMELLMCGNCLDTQVGWINDYGGYEIECKYCHQCGQKIKAKGLSE
jgi:hypothetical protein